MSEETEIENVYDDEMTAAFYANRVTAEDRAAQLFAEWDAGQSERDTLDAKKKKAVDELVALGLSLESASLICQYYK